jgi:MYXO-CTERM domain-containing protein
MALVDSEGNPTGVTFSISGPTAGWGGVGGRLDLVRDYLFVDAGNVAGDLTADWTTSGLDPTHTYEMFAYGGVARDMAMTVDLDGDGALDNDTGRLVDATGLLFGPITPDAAGNIIGRMANGTGDAEGNWSGFQLRDITAAVIPEPSSVVLAALALLGLGLYGLRRRRPL